MKKIILTEQQLKDYIERKKAQKTFNSILTDMYNNSKNLNENISINKANQTIIENYRLKNLLTPDVLKMLNEYGLTNNKGQII